MIYRVLCIQTVVVDGISEPSTVLGFLDIRKNGGGGYGDQSNQHQLGFIGNVFFFLNIVLVRGADTVLIGSRKTRSVYFS